jgi:hypothetical protein
MLVGNDIEADRLLAAINAARSRGVDVHGDHYPYDWATNPLRLASTAISSIKRPIGASRSAQP